MNTQIETAIKRARGYWFVDGFIEIAAGLLLILLAVFLLNSMQTARASFFAWFLSVTGEVAILKLVSFVSVVLILWWLKDKFTYPRTGFVRGKFSMAQMVALLKNLVLFLLLPVAGLLITSLLITSTSQVVASMPVWFPIGVSFLWGILLWLAGAWMGLQRFHWTAALLVLTGLGVGIWQERLGLPNLPAKIQPDFLQPAVWESINRSLTGLGCILIGSGVIFLLAGILTFMRYRKENPQPYTEEE